MSLLPRSQKPIGTVELPHYSRRVVTCSKSNVTIPTLGFPDNSGALSKLHMDSDMKTGVEDTYLWIFKLNVGKTYNASSNQKTFARQNQKRFAICVGLPFKVNGVENVIKSITDTVIKKTSYHRMQEHSCIGSTANQLTDIPIQYMQTSPSFLMYMMGIIITKRNEG